MDFLQSLLEDYNIPILSALILGLMTAKTLELLRFCLLLLEL